MRKEGRGRFWGRKGGLLRDLFFLWLTDGTLFPGHRVFDEGVWVLLLAKLHSRSRVKLKYFQNQGSKNLRQSGKRKIKLKCNLTAFSVEESKTQRRETVRPGT